MFNRLPRARAYSPALSIIVLASAAQAAPSLERVGTYSTGLGANGAEIVSVRESDHIAAITNIAGSVDVIDLSDPTQPVLIRRVATPLGTPNSVALHPAHDYFLTASGSAGAIGKVAAYRISDGSLLQAENAGTLPDSVAIAPNGQWAVVANEAEGTGTGANGGEGSLTLIDLSGFNGSSPRGFTVTQVPLPSQAGVAGFSTGRTDDAGRLAVDDAPATLEPESVAFSPNSRYAYVTLQENNGVVRMDSKGGLTFFGLGITSHAADLTTSGGYAPVETLTLQREPDGIALLDGGVFVTADEGDTRTGSGGSGPRGGRTVSVFDATSGALLGDTGAQLDDMAGADGIYPDARSNRGGSEPEVLDAAHWRGQALVAVGLERANAVALIDLSDPSAPLVLDLEVVDAAPEGIKFYRDGSNLYVLSANEAAGTLSVLAVRD